MDQSINSLVGETFQKALASNTLTEDDKLALEGLYFLALYKNLLEFLILTKGPDKEFVHRLHNFVSQELETIPEKEKLQKDLAKIAQSTLSDIVASLKPQV